MRRRLFITILTISALFLASCEKEPVLQQGDGNYYPIFRGYMQFSTEVSTRAQLATNMRGREFGVLGYSYPYTTDWDAARLLAVPDVFYNQAVSCNDNGICTYDTDADQNGSQLKPWDSTKWYTFFAYHPYGGKGISLSDASISNTPYLTYEYDWLEDAMGDITINANRNDKIFDLMTAEAEDVDGTSNVDLNFKHRLFAIEILANNYNESEFEMEPQVDEEGNTVLDNSGNPVMVIKRDENGNPILAKDANGDPISDKSQLIRGLTLTISGLAHTKMTVPMSMRGEEADKITYYPSEELQEKEVMFNIQNKPVTIPAFNDPQPDGRGSGVATSISKLGCAENDGYLMLIPQNQSLDFTVNWTDAPNNFERTISSTMNFEAGKLYQIIINFVGSGITIALIEAGAWDYRSVTHTFE